MRIKRTAISILLFSLVLAGIGPLVMGQGTAGGIRLLLVDETKTFTSTMRVGALAGALKGSDLFEVSVRLVDVASSYEDPLRGLTPDQAPFKIILILPRGLDDISVSQIWLVTQGLEHLTPLVQAGVAAASQMLDQVFQGIGEAIDVSEDLWPGLLAALYLKEGWLR